MYMYTKVQIYDTASLFFSVQLEREEEEREAKGEYDIDSDDLDDGLTEVEREQASSLRPHTLVA